MEKNWIKRLIKEEEFCEKSSSKTIKDFVPHQAISLKELVTRFERGQRLNVHENFEPLSNCTNGNYVYEEDFEDAPPDDIHDVVDVHEYYKEHQAHKADYSKRQKEKREKAKLAPAKQADDPTPPDPAKSNLSD